MLPEMARFGMSVCHSPGNRGHPGMCTMFHLGESYSLYLPSLLNPIIAARGSPSRTSIYLCRR